VSRRDLQPDLFGDGDHSDPKPPKHWSIQWADYLIQHKLLTPLCLVAMYLQLSGKIDFTNLITKKPYRLSADEAQVLDDDQLTSLTKFLAKHKIILKDGYLYSFDEGENIIELIEEIKKYKAVPTASTSAIPKRVLPKSKKPLAKKKKKAPAAQAQKEDRVERCVAGILGEVEECSSFSPEDRDECIERIIRECNE
jgi:hypothetical protein